MSNMYGVTSVLLYKKALKFVVYKLLDGGFYVDPFTLLFNGDIHTSFCEQLFSFFIGNIAPSFCEL